MVTINQKLKNEESGLVSSPKYGRFRLTASCLFCLPSLLISLSEDAAGTVDGDVFRVISSLSFPSKNFVTCLLGSVWQWVVSLCRFLHFTFCMPNVNWCYAEECINRTAFSECDIQIYCRAVFPNWYSVEPQVLQNESKVPQENCIAL